MLHPNPVRLGGILVDASIFLPGAMGTPLTLHGDGTEFIRHFHDVAVWLDFPNDGCLPQTKQRVHTSAASLLPGSVALCMNRLAHP